MNIPETLAQEIGAVYMDLMNAKRMMRNSGACDEAQRPMVMPCYLDDDLTAEEICLNCEKRMRWYETYCEHRDALSKLRRRAYKEGRADD